MFLVYLINFRKRNGLYLILKKLNVLVPAWNLHLKDIPFKILADSFLNRIEVWVSEPSISDEEKRELSSCYYIGQIYVQIYPR